MPTKDAKRYLEREWANSRRMYRQFCADLRAAKIKYYLSFIICLLLYGLLTANILARGRLIGDPGAAIILALVAPAGFLAVIVYRAKYHRLNG